MRAVLLALFSTTLAAFSADTVSELLARAQSDPTKGKPLVEQALALARANAEKTPQSPATHYDLASAHFELQEDAAATAATEQALKLKPDFPEAILLRAKLYAYAKDLPRAQQAISKAIELKPDYVEAWYWRGCGFEEEQKNKEALEAFLKVLALKEDHAEAHHKAGSQYNRAGNKQEAVKHYTRAAALKPQHADTQFNTGVTLQSMRKFDEALPYIEAALKLEPKAMDFLQTRVQVLGGMGDAKRVDEAIAALRAAWSELPPDKRKSLFVRERFDVGELRVIVAQYYELKGERAVRYSFNVRKTNDDPKGYRISLGSYDVTNEMAHSLGGIKPGERRYHMDGYYPGDEHRTFGFYNGEPAYADVKKTVIEIIEGKKEEMSSSKPGEVIIKQ